MVVVRASLLLATFAFAAFEFLELAVNCNLEEASVTYLDSSDAVDTASFLPLVAPLFAGLMEQLPFGYATVYLPFCVS